MNTLTKKVVTQVTFRAHMSDPSDVRYLRLQYDSEGAGRYFVLSDQQNFDGKGHEIYLNCAADFLMLYEAAKEMEDQGSIFYENEDW